MVLRPRGRGRVGRRRHLLKAAVTGQRPSFFRAAQARPPTAPTPGCRLTSGCMTRAGIVTVAGKPNAGKSTLLNRVVGTKLSIVSDKPQSTRDRIVGIRTDDDVQMILLDTPGLLNPRYALQQAMRATAVRALEEADSILYLVDATEVGGQLTPLPDAAGLARPPRAPVVIALNKADLLAA